MHKFYLKQQIKVRLILFTLKTNKSIVAQHVLTPIMCNGTDAHSFLQISKVINYAHQVEAKKQLRGVIWDQFLTTAQLRTLFFASFI